MFDMKKRNATLLLSGVLVTSFAVSLYWMKTESDPSVKAIQPIATQNTQQEKSTQIALPTHTEQAEQEASAVEKQASNIPDEVETKALEELDDPNLEAIAFGAEEAQGNPLDNDEALKAELAALEDTLSNHSGNTEQGDVLDPNALPLNSDAPDPIKEQVALITPEMGMAGVQQQPSPTPVANLKVLHDLTDSSLPEKVQNWQTQKQERSNSFEQRLNNQPARIELEQLRQGRVPQEQQQ